MAETGSFFSLGNAMLGFIFVGSIVASITSVPSVQATPASSQAPTSLEATSIASSAENNAPQSSSIPADPDNLKNPISADSTPSSSPAAPTVSENSSLSLKFPASFGAGSPYPVVNEKELVKFVEWVSLCNGVISLDGHTDSAGTEKENQELGKSRAQKISKILELKGISAKQMKIVSSGSSKPAKPNNTYSGQAENRRVVATCLQ